MTNGRGEPAQDPQQAPPALPESRDPHVRRHAVDAAEREERSIGRAAETQAQSPAARRGPRLAAAAGIVGTLTFLALAELVPRGLTDGFDAAVLRALRQLEDPRLPLGGQVIADIARDVTALGGTTVLLLVVGLVAGYLFADGRRRDALVVVAAAGGGVLLSAALKFAFARERPDTVPHLAHATSASFPSGHAMLSAVIYLTMGALLARFAKRRRLEVFPLAAAVGITVLVGFTRIVLGVHHPTDVFAGWGAGAAWASVCWLAADRLAKQGKVEGKA